MVTPDLSYDYYSCGSGTEKKGEENKWDGGKQKKNCAPVTVYLSLFTGKLSPKGDRGAIWVKDRGWSRVQAVIENCNQTQSIAGPVVSYHTAICATQYPTSRIQALV